jgi:hypothetical protein
MLQVEHTGDEERLKNVAADVSQCAARGSLLVGLATGWSNSEVRESLASSGFMGSVTDWELAGEDPDATTQSCLFATQQTLFSLAQTGLFNRHVEAANETDEDFFGNFS